MVRETSFLFGGRIGVFRRALALSLTTMISFPLTVCAQAPAPQPPVTNFEECVKEGGEILKSYPAQCVSRAGDRFFDTPKKPQGSACRDLCGNGSCEEIVCMATGCPCGESPASCPQDCR
jgi:hypothetical protein